MDNIKANVSIVHYNWLTNAYNLNKCPKYNKLNANMMKLTVNLGSYLLLILN